MEKEEIKGIQIEEEIEKFQRKFKEFTIQKSNFTSIGRKIGVLNNEICEVNNQKELLERETGIKLEVHSQTLMLLKKDLDLLGFKVKERNMQSNQIYSQLKEIYDNIAKNNSVIENMKQKLKEISNDKRELNEKIKKLERETNIIKTNNIQIGEENTILQNELELLSMKVKEENENVLKMENYKVKLAGDLTKEEIEKLIEQKRRLVQDEIVIDGMNSEVNQKENRLLEINNELKNNVIYKKKETIAELEEKLNRMKIKRKMVLDENEELKQEIEEVKKIILQFERNSKSLISRLKEIELTEEKINAHLKLNEEFSNDIAKIVEILNFNGK